MTASTQLVFDKSYVLTAEDLQRVADSFAVNIGTPRVELQCSDLITRAFETADAATDYDNAPSKRIESVRIIAFSPDTSERAFLTISAGEGSSFFLSLDASEEHVRKLKEAIDDRVAGMKPWYAWLTRINFMTIGFFGYCAA